ncbi:LCCL domain-containing protein [Fortiea contorta]|uniref:LCCL domain-containing protein n=1 Tax=Fortiea contorta TaxID=1892405 RepID=UPI0013760A07
MIFTAIYYSKSYYTDDSSICSAAVHAGLMTTKQGGVVTIRIKPGQPSYSGTKRYGVNSQNYGSWDGSFVLLKQ